MSDREAENPPEPIAEGVLAEGSQQSPAPEPAEQKRPRTALQDLVDEPAKVMRIGTMVRQLLEEVKSAPLDEAARSRLAEIH